MAHIRPERNEVSVNVNLPLRHRGIASLVRSLLGAVLPVRGRPAAMEAVRSRPERRRLPVTSHPAFAPACAVWWALLLGGAGWMLQPMFFPGLSILPATAGPAIVGGAVGSVLARLAVRQRQNNNRELSAEPQEEFQLEEAEEKGRILEVEQLPPIALDEDYADAEEIDRFADLPSKLRSPLDSRGLDEMGSTELLERLAAAMHRYMAIKGASEA